MRIGPFDIALRKKALPSLQPLSRSGNGWFPWGIIHESFTGAWQQNVELRADQVMTNPTLFAVVTRIATDAAKLGLGLVEKNDDDVWNPIESPAFSPVLRRPNHYQHITEFIEQWMLSKLTQGNTYVLLQRDQRRVVKAMYILDPSRVTPLVSDSGDVYYQLRRDDLSGLREESVTVPASEIIHDRMPCLFHPLIGVTPIYACGAPADQANTIARNSTKFFANGSQPGGVLLVPGNINDDTALRLKASFDTNYGGDNYGKLAVLSDGMKLEYPQRHTARDSELISQMNWTDERICSVYHMPAWLVGVGTQPPYGNEQSVRFYHSFCIQGHLNKIEKCLDRGLGLDERIEGKQYGTEFDIDDLIWMDTDTRTKAAHESIGSGGMSPNEARKKYYGMGPVQGGGTPYMQEQNWPLRLLADRELPTRAPTAPAELPTASSTEEDDDMEMAASFASILNRKAIEADLYAA